MYFGYRYDSFLLACLVKLILASLLKLIFQWFGVTSLAFMNWMDFLSLNEAGGGSIFLWLEKIPFLSDFWQCMEQNFSIREIFGHYFFPGGISSMLATGPWDDNLSLQRIGVYMAIPHLTDNVPNQWHSTPRSLPWILQKLYYSSYIISSWILEFYLKMWPKELANITVPLMPLSVYLSSNVNFWSHNLNNVDLIPRWNLGTF